MASISISVPVPLSVAPDAPSQVSKCDERTTYSSGFEERVGELLEVRAVNRHAVDSSDGVNGLRGLGETVSPGENGDPTGKNMAEKFHLVLVD